MKTPLFLLAAGLLFWGWHTGLLVVAALVAALFEGSRLIRFRLDLGPSDFNRITDGCTLLFLGVFAYIYATHRTAGAIFVMIQKMPLVVLPIVLAQVYSTSEQIRLSALFLFLRKGTTRHGHDAPGIDLTYPYFALCLLCASAANNRSLGFYIVLFLLSAWAMWPVRPKVSPYLWVGLLVLAGILGYVGQMGLSTLQTTLEKKTIQWLTKSIQIDSDPYKAITKIGDIGTIKLSDRIVLRVDVEPGHDPPQYLRETSYNVYGSGTWFAVRSPFEDVSATRDPATWQVGPDKSVYNTLTVSDHLDSGEGFLKLPNGTFEIANLPVAKVVHNPLGAVKVEGGPGLINYRIRYNRAMAVDGPPTEKDLEVPEKEVLYIQKIIKRLGLKQMRPSEIRKALVNCFGTEFAYSLTQERTQGTFTALGNFLTRSRAGHCEHFATATVLTLRALGIPARYATGYVVQEFSSLEKRYIVRARHAHAWALVYHQDHWSDFDTTPSSWTAMDNEHASVFQPIYDFISFLSFRFSQWRWSQRKSPVTSYMLGAVLLLILVLVWRLVSRYRVVVQVDRRQEPVTGEMAPEMESDFCLIEKRIKQMGYERQPWETLGVWIERLKGVHDIPFEIEALNPLLKLHYRYRFDPKGIAPDEKKAFHSGVRSWLEKVESLAFCKGRSQLAQGSGFQNPHHV